MTTVSPQRQLLGLVLLPAGLCLAILLGLLIGGQTLAPDRVFAALAGRGEAIELALVWESRVPRTLAAVVAGAGLGIAASLLQTLTRNPVADAGLLGSNAGATALIAIGMFTGLAAGPVLQGLWAFAGALAVTVFVTALGLSGRNYSVTRLILLGVALGAVLIGFTNALMLSAPLTFDGMRHWLAGSMVGVPLAVTLVSGAAMLAAIILGIVSAHSLELTLMGDDIARSLGVRLLTTRIAVVVSVSLASALATALVGPISFVGLIAAHAASGLATRWGMSAAMRHMTAAFAGATVLVLADLIGRVALWPGELPAGIVAAVLGAPFMLWLIRRQGDVR